MSDIVERLRDDRYFGFDMRCEAADEIERLRCIERAATEAYEYHLTGYGAHVDFDANTQLDLMNALGKALEGRK